MKSKIVIYCLVFLLLAGCSPKSEKTSFDVPSNVKESFNKLFSDATNVQWSKESDSEYEAEFNVGSAKKSSNFDQSGKWLVTETVIKGSDLPAAIQTAIANEFASYSIEEAEVVEPAEGGIFYEVELESGDVNIEVLFSPEGKVLKKEVSKDEDDEKD